MTSFSPFYGLGSGGLRCLGKHFGFLKRMVASLPQKLLFFPWRLGVSLTLSFCLFGFLDVGVVDSLRAEPLGVISHVMKTS